MTGDDIKEFFDGMSSETAAATNGGQVESALTFPYDKSYEISKEMLEIRKKEI